MAVKAGAGASATKVLWGQTNIMVKMEKILMTFSVTSDDANKKALDVHGHLKAKEINPVPEFNASTGWFFNFKARYGFHKVKRSGEAKIADEDAAAAYPACLKAALHNGSWSEDRSRGPVSSNQIVSCGW